MTVSYAFVMSVSSAATKQAQTFISVPTMLFWQSALCCLFVMMQIWGSWKGFSASVWRVLFLRSFCGFAALLCYYNALNHIPILEASLLRTCAPLCVPLIVLIFYKKAVPTSRWIPLLVGFLGAAVVIHPTPERVSVWHIVGFLSAIGLAVSMVTTRMLSSHISHNEALFVYFAFSTVFAFLLVVGSKQALLLPVASWSWVFLVCVTLYVGMYLYTMAYTYAPASIVSPVSYVGLVFNGLWGWMFWNQIPDIYAWLGTVLVFLSILLTARLKV